MDKVVDLLSPVTTNEIPKALETDGKIRKIHIKSDIILTASFLRIQFMKDIMMGDWATNKVNINNKIFIICGPIINHKIRMKDTDNGDKR